MANATNNAPTPATKAATPAATITTVAQPHGYHIGKTLRTAPLWVAGKPYNAGANNQPAQQALMACLAANPKGATPAQLVAAVAAVGNWQYANWVASKGVLVPAPK